MARWAFVVVALHKKPRRDGGIGNDVSIRHFVGVLDAASEDEALGKAVRFSEKFYPRDKGWGDHSRSVQRVSDQDLTDLDAQVEAPTP
jgi:hypothetical protein